MQVYKGREKVLEKPLGAVDTLEWLDDETLLLSYQKSEADDYDSVIATLAVGGTLTEVVNSEGSDYMAKPLR